MKIGHIEERTKDGKRHLFDTSDTPRFNEFEVSPELDLFETNIDALEQEAANFRRLESAAAESVEHDGVVYPNDDRTAAAMQRKSSMAAYKGRRDISFKLGKKMVKISRADAEEIFIKMEQASQAPFDALEVVTEQIQSLKDMDDVRAYDLTAEWEKACGRI